MESISFFAPVADLNERAREYLGRIPIFPLFTTLDFEYIGPLILPLHGNGFPTYKCGHHWVLYTLADVPPMEEFVPSSVDELGSTIDIDLIPSDKLAMACVYCLDNLSNTTSNDNVKLLSKLFARHICATDMSMEDIIEYNAIAKMVATGMSVWTIGDPLLYSDALDLHSLLETKLECKIDRPKYIPFWLKN